MSVDTHTYMCCRVFSDVWARVVSVLFVSKQMHVGRNGVSSSATVCAQGNGPVWEPPSMHATLGMLLCMCVCVQQGPG